VKNPNVARVDQELLLRKITVAVALQMVDGIAVMMAIGGLANMRSSAGKMMMVVTAHLGMIVVDDILTKSLDLTRSTGQSMMTRKKHHREGAAEAKVGEDPFASLDIITVMTLQALAHVVREAGAEAVHLIDVAIVSDHIHSVHTVVFEVVLEALNALIGTFLGHLVAKSAMTSIEVRTEKEIETVIVTVIVTVTVTVIVIVTVLGTAIMIVIGTETVSETASVIVTEIVTVAMTVIVKEIVTQIVTVTLIAILSMNRIVAEISITPQTLTATYRLRATEQAKRMMPHDTERRKTKTGWTIAKEIRTILTVIERDAVIEAMTEIDAKTEAEAGVLCPMIDDSH